MRIIGIHGKAESGKDTLGRSFMRAIRPQYKSARIAFADALKSTAMTMFNLTHEQAYEQKDYVHPVYGMTVRDLLQKLGTEFARDMIDTDFWVKRAEMAIKEFEAEVTQNDPKRVCFVVMPDVRFNNEARFIRRYGGHIVEVLRDGPSTLTDIEKQHKSEQGINREYIDFVVNNNRSIQALESQAVEILSETGWL